MVLRMYAIIVNNICSAMEVVNMPFKNVILKKFKLI